MTECDTIEAIRAELRAKNTDIASVIPPVRSISTVGGLFINGAFEGVDEDAFEHVICYLADSGIPIDPNFTITNYNLNPEYGGRDFLNQPDPADLIVFLVVFNPGSPQQVRYYAEYPKNLESCVSPKHSAQAFRQAARATEAHFIACKAFGSTEIGEWVFRSETPSEAGYDYETVVSTRERFSGVRETLPLWTTLPCSFSCEKTTLGLLAQAFAAQPDPGKKSTILHRAIRNLGIREQSCP